VKITPPAPPAPPVPRRYAPDAGLYRLFLNGMETLPMFESMQRRGLPASRSRFETLTSDMSNECSAIGTEISTLYYNGEPFNPNSRLHVAELMRRRKLRGEKRTDSGGVSTSKGSIEHLRTDDKAIDAIFNWRERRHIRDSFCRYILEVMDDQDADRLLRASEIPEEFRDESDPDLDLYYVRCQIQTTRVATRRLASKKPNLLAIPTRTKLGNRVRECYVCPPGYLFGSYDLSQIEMRVLADFSGDANLIRFFREGLDIHRETASIIYRVPTSAVTPKQRTFAKTINYGIVYGIGPPGLQAQLRILGIVESKEECASMISRVLRDVYPGISSLKQQITRDVERDPRACVYDYWGMRRYLPGIWSSDNQTRAEAEREAIAFVISATAQGMVQNSMRWLREPIETLQDSGFEVYWSLEPHDELLLEIQEELCDTVGALVIEGLTQHSGIELCVPIESSGTTAQSWGGLKE
jgi:DNA polymerase-1